MKRRIHNYAGAYKGNYWAIVLGHKDPDCKPCVLHQFVETKWKRDYIEREQDQHPGMKIRAIPQPIPPEFEPGM